MAEEEGSEQIDNSQEWEDLSLVSRPQTRRRV